MAEPSYVLDTGLRALTPVHSFRLMNLVPSPFDVMQNQSRMCCRPMHVKGPMAGNFFFKLLWQNCAEVQAMLEFRQGLVVWVALSLLAFQKNQA